MSTIDLVDLVQRAVSAGVAGVLLSVGHLSPAPVGAPPRAEESRSALPWEASPWDGAPWDGLPGDGLPGDGLPGDAGPGGASPRDTAPEGRPGDASQTDPVPWDGSPWDAPSADPPPGDPLPTDPPPGDPLPAEPPPAEPPPAEPSSVESPSTALPPADPPPPAVVRTPDVVRTPGAPPPAHTAPPRRAPDPERAVDPQRAPDPVPGTAPPRTPRTPPPADTSSRGEPVGAATTTTRDGTTAGRATPDRSEEFDTAPPARDVRSAGRASVHDGVLTLAGAGALCWTGARTHGRWEVRMRVPAAAGAVLLAGADPRSGEIRFADLDGARATYTVRGTDGVTRGSAPVDATRWHVWTVEWTPDAVVGLVDGRAWFRTHSPAVLPRGPLFLCLQAGAAGTVEVDHVREFVPGRGQRTPDR